MPHCKVPRDNIYCKQTWVWPKAQYFKNFVNKEPRWLLLSWPFLELMCQERQLQELFIMENLEVTIQEKLHCWNMVAFVWKSKGEAFNPKNTVPTVKHGGIIMLWGCYAASGTRNLVCVHKTMKKSSDILKNNLKKVLL